MPVEVRPWMEYPVELTVIVRGPLVGDRIGGADAGAATAVASGCVEGEIAAVRCSAVRARASIAAMRAAFRPC